jgi:hypothetical protein
LASRLRRDVIDAMYRKTGIKHLRAVAERCDTANRPVDEPILMEMYAYGDILDPTVEELDYLRVALVLDLPAEEVTWLALPDVAIWLSYHLGMDKNPVHALRRPAVWPVWNHFIRRPLRLWTYEGGSDEAAFAALAEGDVESLRLADPSPEELAEQLAMERDASLAHLRRVQESLHDREWRSGRKGFGNYPEDHLWHAVEGYLDLLDAERKAPGRAANAAAINR